MNKIDTVAGGGEDGCYYAWWNTYGNSGKYHVMKLVREHGQDIDVKAQTQYERMKDPKIYTSLAFNNQHEFSSELIHAGRDLLLDTQCASV